MEQGVVALALRRADHRSEVLRFDHIIAGTGFRTVSPGSIFLAVVARELAVVEGSPVLSTTFGRLFPDCISSDRRRRSVSAMMRFAFGARYVARRLTLSPLSEGVQKLPVVSDRGRSFPNRA